MRQCIECIIYVTHFENICYESFWSCLSNSNTKAIFPSLYFSNRCFWNAGTRVSRTRCNGSLLATLLVNLMVKLESWLSIKKTIKRSYLDWGPSQNEKNQRHRWPNLTLGSNKLNINNIARRRPFPWKKNVRLFVILIIKNTHLSLVKLVRLKILETLHGFTVRITYNRLYVRGDINSFIFPVPPDG